MRGSVIKLDDYKFCVLVSASLHISKLLTTISSHKSLHWPTQLTIQYRTVIGNEVQIKIHWCLKNLSRSQPHNLCNAQWSSSLRRHTFNITLHWRPDFTPSFGFSACHSHLWAKFRFQFPRILPIYFTRQCAELIDGSNSPIWENFAVIWSLCPVHYSSTTFEYLFGRVKDDFPREEPHGVYSTKYSVYTGGSDVSDEDACRGASKGVKAKIMWRFCLCWPPTQWPFVQREIGCRLHCSTPSFFKHNTLQDIEIVRHIEDFIMLPC